MNTKHTPDKWFADTEYHDGKQFAIHGRAGTLVATVAKQVKTPSDPENGFAASEVANAKLIAAAPELLEALQGLITELTPAYNFDLRNAPEPVQKAIEAIKKATE